MLLLMNFEDGEMNAIIGCSAEVDARVTVVKQNYTLLAYAGILARRFLPRLCN
mgnify:CR=1 FL=1